MSKLVQLCSPRIGFSLVGVHDLGCFVADI